MFSTNYSQMSDSELDSAYVVARDANRSSEYTAIALEINSRNEGVFSFLSGVVGYERFPKYANYKGNFSNVTAAQGSVSDSAGNVADKLTFGFSAAYILVFLLAITYLVFKFKK